MLKKDTIFIEATGKINLYLDVLGKRTDGYHELRSILVPVNICDTLKLQMQEEKISVEIEYDFEHLDKIPYIKEKDNLVYKIANSLKELTGYKGGVHIKIDKKIPVAAGLGGGSGDAAATLHGLNHLWNLNLKLDTLMDIGARFGSDIPAMVMGGSVIMEGRGTKCTPIALNKKLENWKIVLFNPGISVSTGDIYKRYNSLLTKEKKVFYNTLSLLEQGEPADAGNILFNDLQATVLEKYPLIRMLIDKINDKNPHGCLLSGSGATVFAVVKNDSEAQNLIDYVNTKLECPLWTRTVNLLPDSVMVAHGPLTA